MTLDERLKRWWEDTSQIIRYMDGDHSFKYDALFYCVRRPTNVVEFEVALRCLGDIALFHINKRKEEVTKDAGK